MRFRLGPPPSSLSESALAPGVWHKIPFPSLLLQQLLALPVGVVTTFLTLLAWRSFRPHVTLDFPPLWQVATAVLLTVALGMGISLLVHPTIGRGSKSLVGFWPSRFLPYTYHLDPQPKSRFIADYIAPCVLLSLTPLSTYVVFRVQPGWLMFTSCVAALFFGQNFVLGLWVAAVVPSGTIVAEREFQPYWRYTAGET